MMIGSILATIFPDINAIPKQYYIFFSTLVWAGLIIAFYLTIKIQKKQSQIDIVEITSKFKVGVLCVYIGYLGLIVFYSLIAYEFIVLSGVSAVSAFLFIPLILWMGFFSVLGFNLISNQIYLQDLQKRESSLTNKIEKNSSQKNIHKIEKEANNQTLLIILIPTLIIIFLTVTNRIKTYGNKESMILINCNKNKIITKNSSSTKVYFANKSMASLNPNNYSTLGTLDGNKIILTNQYLDIETIKECLTYTDKYHLILSDEVKNITNQKKSIKN